MRIERIEIDVLKKYYMKANSWIDFKIEIRERLKTFALKILELSEKFPKTPKANIINYQLTKSGTSVYANYRAALRGRSKAEFFSKLSISVEEADESDMWLDMCITSGIFKDDFVKNLHKESLEIVKILSNLRKKTSSPFHLKILKEFNQFLLHL